MTEMIMNVNFKHLFFVAFFSIFLVTMATCSLLAADAPIPDLEQDWLVTPRSYDESQPFVGVFCIGRVTYVDGKGVDTEDRVSATENRYERLPGAAILLKGGVDLERMKRLLFEIETTHSASDHLWLANGDDFSCDFFHMNKRFVFLRAFGVDMRVPRGKVVAIRFRNAQDIVDRSITSY